MYIFQQYAKKQIFISIDALLVFKLFCLKQKVTTTIQSSKLFFLAPTLRQDNKRCKKIICKINQKDPCYR